VRPMRKKAMYTARPTITNGTIIGASRIAITPLRNGKFPRTSAREARVPSTTASSAESTATWKLEPAEVIHVESSTILRYQRSESSFGGNDRNELLPSDIGMTTSTGSNR